jgi:hypothetical protein
MSIPAPRRCHELLHAPRRYYKRMRISVEALIPMHLRLLLGSHLIHQHLLFSVELQSAKELKSNTLRSREQGYSQNPEDIDSRSSLGLVVSLGKRVFAIFATLLCQQGRSAERTSRITKLIQSASKCREELGKRY